VGNTNEVSDQWPSLAQAVAAVSTTDDGKTRAIYDFPEEPVVGWLVCVKGEHKGEGFILRAGRNSIGRNLEMDVRVAKEGSVSRNKHAILTFEPKKQIFLVQPGEGSGLTYLNDELVLAPQEIKDYDRLTLGKAEFLLRSFANERFNWDQE
jgi:hypothetical protein